MYTLLIEKSEFSFLVCFHPFLSLIEPPASSAFFFFLSISLSSHLTPPDEGTKRVDKKMVSRYWASLEVSGGVGTTAFGGVGAGEAVERQREERDGKEITRNDECGSRDTHSRRKK